MQYLFVEFDVSACDLCMRVSFFFICVIGEPNVLTSGDGRLVDEMSAMASLRNDGPYV